MLWEMMHTRIVFADKNGLIASLRVMRHQARPRIELSPERAPFAEIIDACGSLEPFKRPKVEEVTEVLWTLLRTPHMQESITAPSWAIQVSFQANLD
mmetsp:Transcript_30432/g.61140  ORF Transcript_30432/g.61140 Transcript_30432/m.61140 type:complete len:97 (-) Transcript_30432:169-459(-)